MDQLLFYPALFHIAEEGGFWVSFPDFPECMTQGESMEESYKMAVEALGLCITDMQEQKQKLPVPSNPKQVKVEEDTVLCVVEFDLLAYKKRMNNRAVKKTLSIPAWLNEEALSMDINFSQVLQEALLQKVLRP